MSMGDTSLEYFGLVTLLIMRMMSIERWCQCPDIRLQHRVAVARWSFLCSFPFCLLFLCSKKQDPCTTGTWIEALKTLLNERRVHSIFILNFFQRSNEQQATISRNLLDSLAHSKWVTKQTPMVFILYTLALSWMSLCRQERGDKKN